MKRSVGDWMRLVMVGACVLACLIVASGAVAYAVVQDLRALAEANPAFVRAEGEAAILYAAADAVRADTRIAGMLPWLVLVAGLELNALLLGGAVWVWRRNLENGRV